MTDILGAPRMLDVTLSNGSTVTLHELALADIWPYLNGESVDPEHLIRASLVDAEGRPAIAADEGLPMAQALELLPHILKLNHLEVDQAGEVAEIERDFPRPASAG